MINDLNLRSEITQLIVLFASKLTEQESMNFHITLRRSLIITKKNLMKVRTEISDLFMKAKLQKKKKKSILRT